MNDFLGRPFCSNKYKHVFMIWLTLSQPQTLPLHPQCKLHAFSLNHFWFMRHTISFDVCGSRTKKMILTKQHWRLNWQLDNIQPKIFAIFLSLFVPFLRHDEYCLMCIYIYNIHVCNDLFVCCFSKLTKNSVFKHSQHYQSHKDEIDIKLKKQSFPQNNAVLHQY